mmetsp:Transcript_11187/g.69036  ORF Transcript_11187/g.69036 Transcript_11187/m.69036 type:complete len:208 (-) Transcript_11187:239-862(-)
MNNWRGAPMEVQQAPQNLPGPTLQGLQLEVFVPLAKLSQRPGREHLSDEVDVVFLLVHPRGIDFHDVLVVYGFQHLHFTEQPLPILLAGHKLIHMHLVPCHFDPQVFVERLEDRLVRPSSKNLVVPTVPIPRIPFNDTRVVFVGPDEVFWLGCSAVRICSAHFALCVHVLRTFFAGRFAFQIRPRAPRRVAHLRAPSRVFRGICFRS